MRVLYIKKYPRDSKTGVSILVTVSKKKFKKAVHRNRVKRLVREAYRLNKSILLSSQKEADYDLLVAFLYLGHEIIDFSTLQQKMQNVLEVLKNQLQ